MSTPRAYEPAQRPYLDASRNAWIVSRYDDVLKTLRAANVVTLAEGIGIVSRVSRRTNGSLEDLAAILGGLLIIHEVINAYDVRMG